MLRFIRVRFQIEKSSACRPIIYISFVSMSPETYLLEVVFLPSPRLSRRGCTLQRRTYRHQNARGTGDLSPTSIHPKTVVTRLGPEVRCFSLDPLILLGVHLYTPITTLQSLWTDSDGLLRYDDFNHFLPPARECSNYLAVAERVLATAWTVLLDVPVASNQT